MLVIGFVFFVALCVSFVTFVSLNYFSGKRKINYDYDYGNEHEHE
jgi:hypothetical protein